MISESKNKKLFTKQGIFAKSYQKVKCITKEKAAPRLVLCLAAAHHQEDG